MSASDFQIIAECKPRKPNRELHILRFRASGYVKLGPQGIKLESIYPLTTKNFIAVADMQTVVVVVVVVVVLVYKMPDPGIIHLMLLSTGRFRQRSKIAARQVSDLNQREDLQDIRYEFLSAVSSSPLKIETADPTTRDPRLARIWVVLQVRARF